jgi:hypothetical protein
MVQLAHAECVSFAAGARKSMCLLFLLSAFSAAWLLISTQTSQFLRDLFHLDD